MCLRVLGLDSKKKNVLKIHDHEPSCMKVLDLHYHHLHGSGNFKKLPLHPPKKVHVMLILLEHLIEANVL